jgi:magnesium chelatase family protein
MGASPLGGMPTLESCVMGGELALDGRLRPIRGALAMASMAAAEGKRAVLVPADNAAEASVVSGVEVYPVRDLAQVVGLLTGRLHMEPLPPTDLAAQLQDARASVDFAEVKGQESVKRAIVVAVAGGHNLLMLGPAGTGKTMMAKALPGVLPPLTPQEAVEITRVYSVAGALPPGEGLVRIRPVRTPHHTASAPAIVGGGGGGGMPPRPGELSLAHRGVLFMDELPEFNRNVLETLRQPLEDHTVTISRASGTLRFPADIMFVAAMNPTPKGDSGLGDSSRRDRDRYMARLSGPLLDRIDVHVEAPAVPWEELAKRNGARGTSSAQMRDQALAARARQAERQGPDLPNARLPGKMLDDVATMSKDAEYLLERAVTELGMSARAYDKLRKLSRTIADLAGSEGIETAHMAEAVQYRLLDRRV